MKFAIGKVTGYVRAVAAAAMIDASYRFEIRRTRLLETGYRQSREQEMEDRLL